MRRPSTSLLGPLIGGGVFLLLGIAMVIWPHVIVNMIVPLIGTALLLVGAQGIAYSIVMHSKMQDAGIKLLQGFVNVMVGGVFLLKRDVSALFISILFGLYVLITAAISLSQAVGQMREKRRFMAELVSSVLQLFLGLLLLFSPFSQGDLWVRVLGINFVVTALGMLLWLTDMRRGAAHTREDEDSVL